jgi:superfamily II DNA or RNA helicase
MKASKLLQYQEKAFYNIQEALACGQKRIVIEMPTGFGKGIVFSKTIEYLQQRNEVKTISKNNCMESKKTFKCKYLSS